MILNIEKLRQINQGPMVQETFSNIDLKKYFETLSYLTKNEKYMKTYSQLLIYTQLDSNNCCDFALIEEQKQSGHICPAIQAPVTVGQMLNAARQMITAEDYWCTEYEDTAQKTGCMLVEELFLNPLLDIAGIENPRRT
ncbi:MAG: hypothetical protein IJ642_03405 [Oscillospiraceae bacterium]|nr:hypothetical protein [Oscillospiraceae bacterium]